MVSASALLAGMMRDLGLHRCTSRIYEELQIGITKNDLGEYLGRL
jgi:hypothetical protein